MLVTAEHTRRNRTKALALAGASAGASAMAGWFFPSVVSLFFPISALVLANPAALPPAFEDHETGVPRLVGKGTSISRWIFPGAVGP
jgi:hypothetical protein